MIKFKYLIESSKAKREGDGEKHTCMQREKGREERGREGGKKKPFYD